MAGRPPYQITRKDFSYARRYIERAMQRGDISNVSGYRKFCNAETPEKLQAWCDDYLSEEVFEKLKRAVRASRKRSRDFKTTQRKVTITLDHAAHLRLSMAAEELGMTLSDTILELEDSYWHAKK
jgi:macrodomain Ter protein organizer (MatP/YcbG family)